MRKNTPKQGISQIAYFSDIVRLMQPLLQLLLELLLQVCWDIEMLMVTARPYYKFLTSHHAQLSLLIYKIFSHQKYFRLQSCRLFWLSAIKTAIISRAKATFHYLLQNIWVKNFPSTSISLSDLLKCLGENPYHFDWSLVKFTPLSIFKHHQSFWVNWEHNLYWALSCYWLSVFVLLSVSL